MKNTTFIALNQIIFQTKTFLLRSIIHLFSFPKKKKDSIGTFRKTVSTITNKSTPIPLLVPKDRKLVFEGGTIEEQNYKFNMSVMIWSILNGLEMKVPSKKSQRASI